MTNYAQGDAYWTAWMRDNKNQGEEEYKRVVW